LKKNETYNKKKQKKNNLLANHIFFIFLMLIPSSYVFELFPCTKRMVERGNLLVVNIERKNKIMLKNSKGIPLQKNATWG